MFVMFYRHVEDDLNRERRWPHLVPEHLVSQLASCMHTAAYVVLDSIRFEPVEGAQSS
jgi:hypothetical protein